jgi:hypothetical protein
MELYFLVDVIELYCNHNQKLEFFFTCFPLIIIPVCYVDCFTLKGFFKSDADINKLVFK